MKKTGLFVLVLAVVIGLGGYFILSANRDSNSQPAAIRGGDSSSSQSSEAAAPVDQQVPKDANEPAESVSIDIASMAYRPASVTVKKGATVTWTNQDTVRHDVTPDEDGEAFKGSQLLPQGESYSHTFNEPGTYTYHCSPHPHMTGSVTVTE